MLNEVKSLTTRVPAQDLAAVILDLGSAVNRYLSHPLPACPTTEDLRSSFAQGSMEDAEFLLVARIAGSGGKMELRGCRYGGEYEVRAQVFDNGERVRQQLLDDIYSRFRAVIAVRDLPIHEWSGPEY